MSNITTTLTLKGTSKIVVTLKSAEMGMRKAKKINREEFPWNFH